MLGLVAPAYTGPANFNTAWTNLNLTTATAAAGLNLDVTSMTVGVINRIPIALGRSGGTGSGDVTCFATVESGEILLILGGYDTGSATPFSGSAGSGNTSLVWYWRNTVWTTGVAATSGGQNVSFLPMFAFAGAGTANILRLGDIANGSAQRVSADVIAMRLA
jgi:hypothetical protein